MIQTIKQYLFLHWHSTDEWFPTMYTKIHVFKHCCNTIKTGIPGFIEIKSVTDLAVIETECLRNRTHRNTAQSQIKPCLSIRHWIQSQGPLVCSLLYPQQLIRPQSFLSSVWALKKRLSLTVGHSPRNQIMSFYAVFPSTTPKNNCYSLTPWDSVTKAARKPGQSASTYFI